MNRRQDHSPIYDSTALSIHEVKKEQYKRIRRRIEDTLRKTTNIDMLFRIARMLGVRID